MISRQVNMCRFPVFPNRFPCSLEASGVDEAVVERSSQIHRQLKATASRHETLRHRIAQLPMFARCQVAGCRVGVVHGDADSLAGWRFDTAALADPAAGPWLQSAFEQADVDLFASTHTCLPALRHFALAAGREGCVVNNGAAGMPNFKGDRAGLCTRISAVPSPHPVLHETRVAGACVALVPVCFDAERWRAEFLAQWPVGSTAWLSYFRRIIKGPAHAPSQVLTSVDTCWSRRSSLPDPDRPPTLTSVA